MRANKPLLHGDITASIIDSFFDVHKELGFGFREYIYTRALERLLIVTGHKVERDAVMVYSRGEPLAYERMDLLGPRPSFGKNARFYRVFFENRFKQRNQPCP